MDPYYERGPNDIADPPIANVSFSCQTHWYTFWRLILTMVWRYWACYNVHYMLRHQQSLSHYYSSDLESTTVWCYVCRGAIAHVVERIVLQAVAYKHSLLEAAVLEGRFTIRKPRPLTRVLLQDVPQCLPNVCQLSGGTWYGTSSSCLCGVTNWRDRQKIRTPHR